MGQFLLQTHVPIKSEVTDSDPKKQHPDIEFACLFDTIVKVLMAVSMIMCSLVRVF